MSRRALKAINWAAIAERVPESERATYATFKSKSDQYLQRVMSLPEQPVKIDWMYYKKQVPVAGMVDKFQKEYESLSIPYPADNYTTMVEAQGESNMQAVKDFIEASNKRIVEYQAELERVRNLIPLEEMTLEEYAEAYPDQAINIDKPTIWPHVPEDQPGEEPEPMPKAEH